MGIPLVACLLALTAGFIDGYTYSTTKVFATFQTGNVILPTWHLSNLTFRDFIPGLVSLSCFGAGAMALAFIRDISLKYQKTWVFKVLIFEVFYRIVS